MKIDLLNIFKLPFAEQEKFFKEKLNIPTRKWDDLRKDQHAKGFMVAGAYKADLLTDFRGAVDKTITKGTTLEKFRKDFDNIVKTHGWSYNGGRNWRSEVIYSTNIRQSYHTGRWAQLTDPEQLQVMPYLTYRHGDSRVPRPYHLSWDGITLPADDPWWDTHFGQNGWGCKCRVYGATKSEHAKAKAAGKGVAPDDGYYTPINKKTGEPYIDPQTGKPERIPNGIDRGFDYNPGKAAQEKDYRVLTNKFETLPYDVARKWMGESLKGPAFLSFFDGRIKTDFPVAVLKPEDKNILKSKTQTIWLSPETLLKQKEKHADIGVVDYQLIPEIVDSGEVYQQSGERLVYLDIKDKLYRLGLKRTKDKSGNFMVTLFETTPEKAKKQVVEKYERIR